MMSTLPVQVTYMSPRPNVSSMVVTSNPSIAACSALIGSTSVTITRAPMPRSDCAEPLPTSPCPQMTATLPATITSVARLMPSTSDSRQPYKLSNLDLVTESLTLIAGTLSVPSLNISYKRCTPVVVSSEIPLIFLSSSGYLSCIRIVKSPPSSNIILEGSPPIMV